MMRPIDPRLKFHEAYRPFELESLVPFPNEKLDGAI
jgi:hypothetical protein